MKNIIFSIQKINGFRENIERELKNKFEKVKYIESERLSSNERSIYLKIIRGISSKLNNKTIQTYYETLVEKNYKKWIADSKEICDYFFVISGGSFSIDFLKALRAKNPGIKLILFLWDTLESTEFVKTYKEYDYIFTYDREDVKKYNFIFRTSFYLEELKQYYIEFEKRKIDLYYLGEIKNIERYRFIEKFYDYCKINNIRFFLKLYLRKNKKKMVENCNQEIIIEKKIDYKENLKIVNNSKVIIDIKHLKQTGLTLRSFESIGSESKLITTNQDIKNYDFYNEENILIIKNIDEIEKINKEFFEKEYKKIDSKIKNRYSAKGFIEEIFSHIQ